MADHNPYQTPTFENPRSGWSWRLMPAGVFVLIAAYTLYTAVPPLLRAIQLFALSDRQLVLLRGVSILFLLLAAISFCVGARGIARGSWLRSGFAVGVASLLIFIARYLIHAYSL